MTTKIQSYLSEEINSITQLGGYENLNYLIKTNTSKYILKTYLYNEDTYDLLTEENRILTHLQNFKDTETPHPIKFNNNETLLIININNEQRICRLLSYIEGQFLGEM